MENRAMKRILIATFITLILLVLFSACGESNEVENNSISSLDQTGEEGHWELVSNDYNPVVYDICNTISFPDFEGKSREEWEDYSISIGKIDYEFITWAIGGVLSPNEHYLFYASNKDCLEIDNTMSIFLMDMYSGKEKVLLSGRDDGYYWGIQWLDDETLLCSFTPNYDNSEYQEQYYICDLEGNSKLLILGEFTKPFPYAVRNRMLAYTPGIEGNSLRLVRIEKDGEVTELALKEFDGYPVNGGGICPDGQLIAFPLRFSMGDDPARNVCICDTDTGETLLLEDPVPNNGSDIAAVWVSWNDKDLLVDFSIENSPDANGHNELWRYVF
jgi:hypothetical protein